MLEPAGLDEANLSTTLGTMMKGGVDYADLYFQYSRHQSWVLDEGTVKSGNYGIEQCGGVRAVAGEALVRQYRTDVPPELHTGRVLDPGR